MALIKKGEKLVPTFQPEVPHFRLSSRLWDLAMVWTCWFDAIGLQTIVSAVKLYCT